VAAKRLHADFSASVSSNGAHFHMVARRHREGALQPDVRSEGDMPAALNRD
jgi:hypothetical protein